MIVEFRLEYGMFKVNEYEYLELSIILFYVIKVVNFIMNIFDI